MKYTTPDMELVMFQVMDNITGSVGAEDKPLENVDEIIEDLDNI